MHENSYFGLLKTHYPEITPIYYCTFRKIAFILLFAIRPGYFIHENKY